MIIVKKDSELMTNYVAANPVPAGENFGVFQDKQLQPAVLALSQDSFLYLVINVKGQSIKFNFRETSGIAKGKGKVQAFAVQQAPDLTLDICIATEADKKISDFYLLHGVTLEEITGAIPQSKIIHGQFPTVHHIYMGKKPTSKAERALPLVMVAFIRPDRLTKTEDLNFVLFDKEATLRGDWRLATNPQKILDVSLGTCPRGDGVFVLYKGFNDNDVYVQFKMFSGDSEDMAVQLICPKGAVSLAVFLDTKKNWSVLLVGGEKITAFQPREYLSPSGKGTVIDTLDKVTGLKDLHLSQAGENLRLWYTTDKDAVHYYTTTTSDLAKGTYLPLLAEGHGGRTSSLLSLRPRDGHSDALISSLISVDEYGNLSLLQQDTASQLWQQYPFWHASNQNVMEVKGFMLRMHTAVVNDTNDPPSKADGANLVPGCWLRVSSSGLVRCIINGRHATLSPTAQWHQTDVKGVLNILLETEDATCHQFAADRFRPAKAKASEGERLLTDPILDPSGKVIQKLYGINTAEDIRGLKKPDGTPLLPKVSDEDAKAAAEAIQVLVKQARQIHKDDKQRMESYMTTGFESLPYFTFDDFGDLVVAGWHYLGEKVSSVTKWGCELLMDAGGKIWKFVVHIGKEIYSITINTVSSIIKGIMWVFKKIGAFIKDAIQFLGYLFQWDDILETLDSVATGFNVALDYGQVLLSSKSIDVQAWLDNLHTTIKAQLPGLKKHDYKNSGGSDSSVRDMNADKDDMEKAGVAYNWSTYYFTYGGGTTNAVLHDGLSSLALNSSEQKVLQLWDSILDELKIITKAGVDVATDLVKFFIPGKYDVQELINKLTEDLIDGLFKSLKKLAEILFEALSLGISIVKDLANKVIEIPVLTWLWKNVIAQQRPLSLLNFCALLIAIPTTVLYKAKKSCKPPKLTGLLTKETFGQYVNNQAEAGLASKVLGFSLAAASGVELIAGEFDTIALTADGTFEGMGLEMIPLGPIDALMNVADSASLTFESVGAFVSWPILSSQSATSELGYTDVKNIMKYSKWALTLTNFAAQAVVKVVAKSKKAKRPVIKRWKGTVGAVISVPRLCVALSSGIYDVNEGTKKETLIIDGFTEAALSFGKAWGNAVACWNNEVENELMYVGLAIKQVCTVANSGLKIVDFVEHD